MNNKGQVLVIFLLILPILLVAFVTTVELGLLMTKTYKVKQSTKEAIRYALKSDTDVLERLLSKNTDCTYEVSKNEDRISVVIKGRYNALFGKILNKSFYDFEYNFIGYIDNGKIIIKEE